MSTTNMSLSANDIFQKILDSKGRFVKVRYKSNPKPKAEFKGTNLEKITTTVIRAGVDYSELSSVKDAIAAGTRGEVEPLPFGEWYSDGERSYFPYIISHTPKDSDKNVFYLRLTVSQNSNHHPKSIYYVDNQVVTKEEFSKYLTNSEAAKLLGESTAPPVYNIKLENLLDLTEDA